MKVLHVSTGFPLSFPGGITNYVRALVTSQAKRGDEVHVLARPEDLRAIPLGVALKPYRPSRVAPFSLQIVEEDPSTSEIRKLLQKEQYDIVHFHSSLDLPLHFFRDFGALGVPYVVSLHDYFYICPRIFMVDQASKVCREVDVQKCRFCIGLLDQNNFLRRAAKKVSLQLPRIPSSAAKIRLEYMRIFLEGARLLLAVSTRTAAIYQNIVPKAHFKVEQIGNESAYTKPTAKTRSEKIRLTLIGTLNRMKGAGVLEEFLERVHRLDVEFHFYGRAGEGYDKRLRSLGLICHGSYLPEDLPAIMAKTDIGLVLPVWEDNGPQVAMEFMNYHIPVLGTRRGGVPDIVSESSGLLFDPDSKPEIERAVQWIERVSTSELDAISSGMPHLKTPELHAQRVSELYLQALGHAEAKI